MANYRTNVGELANEVADLLRHDNFDRRIMVWLAMAYNECVNDVPCSLWNQAHYEPSITYNEAINEGSFDPNDIGSPITGIFVGTTTGLVYNPRYLSFSDFDRTRKDNAGAAVAGGTDEPLFWTIGPTVDLEGRGTIMVYPKLDNACTATILFTGRHMDPPSAGSDVLRIPYHWEHVIVLGAAARGAKLVAPALVPVFEKEFQDAKEGMHTIMNYQPDAVKTIRDVGGQWAGARQQMRVQTPIGP